MTLYPRQLDFWRGNYDDASGIQTAPKRGKGDFVRMFLERLIVNPYVALDRFGNELSIESQLAEKANKQTTKIVTSIAKGEIVNFKEVLKKKTTFDTILKISTFCLLISLKIKKIEGHFRSPSVHPSVNPSIRTLKVFGRKKKDVCSRVFFKPEFSFSIQN